MAEGIAQESADEGDPVPPGGRGELLVNLEGVVFRKPADLQQPAVGGEVLEVGLRPGKPGEKIDVVPDGPDVMNVMLP